MSLSSDILAFKRNIANDLAQRLHSILALSTLSSYICSVDDDNGQGEYRIFVFPYGFEQIPSSSSYKPPANFDLRKVTNVIRKFCKDRNLDVVRMEVPFREYEKSSDGERFFVGYNRDNIFIDIQINAMPEKAKPLAEPTLFGFRGTPSASQKTPRVNL